MESQNLVVSKVSNYDDEDFFDLQYFKYIAKESGIIEHDWTGVVPTLKPNLEVRAKNLAGIEAKAAEEEAFKKQQQHQTNRKIAATAAAKAPIVPPISLLDFDLVDNTLSNVISITPRDSTFRSGIQSKYLTIEALVNASADKSNKPSYNAANNANYTAATTATNNPVEPISSSLEDNLNTVKPNLTQQILERDAKLKADAFMNSLLPAAPAPTFNINNLFGGLELRQEDVDLMDEAQFLVENVIVKGHVAAYVSPANGGKTTLFVHLCEELAAGGNIIYYVNVDGSPSDLKRHHAHALKHGYTVVNPSARNQSNSVVMDKLTELAAGTDRLENVVIIIDTLKKFCDLINKSQSKKILEVFRSLSVKGATVCLLGHTNKYKDVNGLEIYEGTSDLRNDVDELIYLDSIKDEVAKTLTITTRPDKVRATFEPISFNVDLEGDRKVTPLQEVVSIFCSEDHKLITLILKVIGGGDSKQQDIIDAVREQSEFSVAKIRSCLIRHRVEGDDYQKWSYELTGFKREYSYKLLPVKEASWFDLDPIATT